MSARSAAVPDGKASLDSTIQRPSQHGEDTQSEAVAAAAPLRKRRRVVNSCAACRKRRSRCDRRQPCSECISSDTLDFCQYPDEAIRPQAAASHAWQNSHSIDQQEERTLAQNPLAALQHEVQSGDQSLAFRVTQLENLMIRQLSLLNQSQLPIQRQNMIIPPGPASPPETTSGRSEVLSHIKPLATAQGYLRGRDGSETKFISARHWTSMLHSFPELRLLQTSPRDRHNPLFRAMSDALERFRHRVPIIKPVSLKTLIPSLSIDTALCALIPQKQVAKAVIDLYVGTFEKLHRIIHIGVFLHQLEYFWKAPESGDLNFTATLIIILRLGLLVRPRNVVPSLHGSSEWIHQMETQSVQLVELYLHFTACSERPSLAGLQTHCLVILARMMDGSEPHVPWKSAGTLLQLGRFMGLDQEPSSFPDTISAFDAEFRRRLWTTIIEIYIHISRTSSLPLAVDGTHYSIRRPVNINDSGFIPCSPDIPIVPENWNQITDATFQHVLSGSLVLRLRLEANDAPIMMDGVVAGEHCVACQIRESLRPINSPFDQSESTIQCTGGYSLQRVFLDLVAESSFLHASLSSFPTFNNHSRQLLHDCCRNILKLHQDPELDYTRRFIVARWFRNDIITSFVCLCLAIRAGRQGILETLLAFKIDPEQEASTIQLLEGCLLLFANPWRPSWKEIEEQDLLILFMSIINDYSSIETFGRQLEINMQKFEVQLPDESIEACSSTLDLSAQKSASLSPGDTMFEFESSSVPALDFTNTSNGINPGFNFDTFMSDFGLDINI